MASKPQRTHIHRVPPTVPTMDLPAGGRRGRVPTPPAWITLGAAGKAWWKWAWSTPQACAWAVGETVAVAHRASIEDILVLVTVDDPDPDVAMAAARLRLTALREAAGWDDKLGLTPKALSNLRWKIVPDPEPVAVVVAGLDDRRHRLTG